MVTPETPAPQKTPPVRPTQLDLGSPIRPARRLHLSRSGDSSPRRSSSPGSLFENFDNYMYTN